MKRIFLLVAIAAGYFSHAQSPQTGDQKICYANLEYIISKLPDMKEIEAEMKSTQTQLRNQIQTRSQEVEKQYTDFNANMNTMTDTVRINKQRELEAALGDLEQMQQNAQLTLQNKQKLFMAPLYLKVNRAIQEVARENGYAIVLTETVGTYDFLLYHQPQKNISDLVLKKLGVTSVEK
jgi:outer membrane protein